MATIAAKKTVDFVSNCVALATKILKLPAQHVWLDYDKEADVLYMSFRRPQRATDTIEMGTTSCSAKTAETLWVLR